MVVLHVGSLNPPTSKKKKEKAHQLQSCAKEMVARRCQISEDTKNSSKKMYFFF